MIVKTTLAISAEHPNLPLDTAATFVGSAATFSITGVPTLPAISVSAVAVSVTNASGAVSTVAAVSGEGGWTATFPASHFAAAGTVKDGVVVAVSGTDENGAARTWTAGVGTIVILSSSPVPAPGDVVFNVRLFDAEPTTPTDGDLWPDGEGGYMIWQDGEAHALGGGASITVDDELSETSENPVQNKVIATALETGYTKWKWSGTIDYGQPVFEGGQWKVLDYGLSSHTSTADASGDVPFYTIEDDTYVATATRTRITPTKTSQLTNDGDGTSNFATVAQLPTWNALKPVGGIPATDLASGVQTSLGKADSALQSGDIIAPSAATASGKAADALAVKNALALKADASSLPYALADVTPTAGAPFVLAECFPIVYTPYGGSAVTIAATNAGDLTIEYNEGDDCYYVSYPNATQMFSVKPDGTFEAKNWPDDSLTFNGTAPTENVTQVLGFTPTAHLADRTSSAVSLTASATLAFPAQTAGKARDFVVRLTLTETNNVVPSVTFPADVAYETEGGEWPDLTEAGTYIVRLTEVPTASESETARFFLQCSSAVEDATPPSAGGGV